jgi:hypothetical protein
MHLHETVKPEFRAKAGLLGFELGGGMKTGNAGVLDLNLRYSFTGVLTSLGADFGGEKIGFYDGVLSYRLQGKKDRLKVFAWGGKSTNDFEKLPEEETHERYKDFFDIGYENEILGAGFRYDHNFNSKVALNARTAYSVVKTNYSRAGEFDSILVDFDRFYRTRIVSTIAELNLLPIAALKLDLGTEALGRLIYYDVDEYSPLADEDFLRPFLNVQFSLSPSVDLEAGVERKTIFNPGVSTSHQWGYRGLVKYNIANANSIYIGLRHGGSMAVTLPVFLEEPASGEMTSTKYELGWQMATVRNEISVKLYSEELEKMTVFPFQNGFLHLADFIESYPEPYIVGNTFYQGKAQYNGIEASWGHNFENGIQFNVNQSFFDSKRSINELPDAPGRFNTQFATHFSISKEIIREKNGKNRIWNFNARVIAQGGLHEPDIDVAKSEALQATVYNNPYLFPNQLKTYKRIDIGIYRTIATSKIKWRYALDIQNAFAFKNEAYHYYDPFLNEIKLQEHLGIIPVLSVQASW